MRGLAPEYEGRLSFEVITVEGDAERAQVAEYSLGSHGLVVLGPDGAVQGKIPGHEFGRDEILAQLRAVLPP